MQSYVNRSILCIQSQRFEDEVVEQVQNCMPKEKSTPCWFDACSLIEDYLHNFFESTIGKRIRNTSSHLPLSSLDVFGVPCSSLQLCKPEFASSSRVAIWCTNDYTHTKVLETSSSFSTSMVSCTINQEHSLFSPLNPIRLGEASRQTRQKQLHHVLVSIALG